MQIVRSTINETEIIRTIRDNYGGCLLDALCMFEYRGLNDAYKCTNGDQSFFFKIYARKDIEKDAIEAEIEVVNHLKQSGLSVAYPISMKNGQYLLPIETPEEIIYARKSHPKDTMGKKLIEKIFTIKERLKDSIKMSYLQNYDMDIALAMVSGVDICLNTPLRPREASGTSGMKAVHNGVMNFSVLDGWWIEGHIEGFTGWSIGPSPTETNLVDKLDTADADDLYHKLETIILPMYYSDRHTWIRMMQNAIGKNAYYFNTHRMMRRYVTEAYIR